MSNQRTPLVTRREYEVFAEYIHHGSQKEAAACMGLTLSTVKNHCTSLYRKTATDSNALECARLLGWITIPAGLTSHHG